MQRRWLILMALLAFAQMAGLAAGTDQPNFEGKWKADLAKCEFGMEPVPESLVYTVEQKGLTLNIERVKQENGNQTKTVRTVEAKLDGATLVLEYSTQAQGYDLNIIERWSLSADGNDLTVFRSISAAEGRTDQKLAFHKQA
jgi:hypothetical protein